MFDLLLKYISYQLKLFISRVVVVVILIITKKNIDSDAENS